MASDKQAVLNAIAKYGASVDHIAARYTNPVTGRALTGRALLAKLLQGESSALSDPEKARTAESGAGAKAWGQFMPESRQTAISKFGLDPWRSVDEAVHSTALHLRGKINGSTGLEGYNPGDPSYTSYILNQKVGHLTKDVLTGSRGASSTVGGAPLTQASSASVSQGAPSGLLGADQTSLGQAINLATAPLPTAPMADLGTPSFAAAPVMAGAGQLPSSGGPVAAPALQLPDATSASLPGAAATSEQDGIGLAGGAPVGAPAAGANRNILVVGDSLGVGTLPYLKSDHLVGDAKVGRSSASGLAVLKDKLASGSFGRIVLDLGTNDGSAAELAKTIKSAKAAARGASIYIPTVNGPGAEQKNAVIRKLAGDNVHVVEWKAPLGPDGVHATVAGYQERARAIRAALQSGFAPAADVNTRVTGSATGKVVVAPGAERAGMGLQKPILGLLHDISASSGREVDVTTGTNHNQFVVGTERESDHWTGNASDLGVGGDARQDQTAGRKGDLIAAHAIQVASGRAGDKLTFAKALRMAKQGGIFNFETPQGRVQVLWRTLEGGNHYNHVHVGLNPGR